MIIISFSFFWDSISNWINVFKIWTPSTWLDAWWSMLWCLSRVHTGMKRFVDGTGRVLDCFPLARSTRRMSVQTLSEERLHHRIIFKNEWTNGAFANSTGSFTRQTFSQYDWAWEEERSKRLADWERGSIVRPLRLGVDSRRNHSTETRSTKFRAANRFYRLRSIIGWHHR